MAGLNAYTTDDIIVRKFCKKLLTDTVSLSLGYVTNRSPSANDIVLQDVDIKNLNQFTSIRQKVVTEY